MSFFIADAMAAAPAAGQSQGGPMGSIIMLAGFIAIFYFLLWRPQRKRSKEHKSLLAGLNKGDEVVTNGGLLGKIIKVSDDFVVVSIAENVEVKIQKPAISATLPKGTIKAV